MFISMFPLSPSVSRERENSILSEGLKPGYVFLEAGEQNDWFDHHNSVEQIDIDPECTTIIANGYNLRLVGSIEDEGCSVFKDPKPGSVQTPDLGKYFAYRFTTIITSDGRIFHDTSLMEGKGENRFRLTHLLREIASETQLTNPRNSQGLSKLKSQIEYAFGIEPI